MGHFVVKVDPETGLKDIQQVPTDEDKRAEMHEALDAKLDAELDARLDADLESGADTPPELTVEDGGAKDDDPPADEAANEIMAGLYRQNVAWAKARITKIQTQAGITAVRDMEKAHPEYKDNDPPGRKGVRNALQERSGEIGEGQTTSDGLERQPKGPGDIEPPPETTRGTGLPCGECEFTAGSQAGMDAHMEAKHPDVAL